jgi:HD-GYP domain-containing protein (c-di-GMP phosphodiesterase class II)
MMNRLSLIKKFTLFSLIAFIITGSGLSLILSHYLKSNMELSELILIVWAVMFLGLIILYAFLLKTVYNVSVTLIRQNNELTVSKKHLEEAIRKLNYSYRETVAAASAAIDARDAYTAGHSRRVADIACKVGKELGMEDSKLECLELAALFHDIGKIGVPDYILNKPGGLDEEEFKKIQVHPVLGYNILGKIEFLSPMLPSILYHHERPDGKGYPEGLKGDEIPIGASIIAIADTYDAMTSNRPYRSALPHETAVAELKKYRGVQFKEEVVDAFLKINSHNSYFCLEETYYRSLFNTPSMASQSEQSLFGPPSLQVSRQ